MGRFSQVFSAALAVVGTAAASAVLDLKPDNFDGRFNHYQAQFFKC